MKAECADGRTDVGKVTLSECRVIKVPGLCVFVLISHCILFATLGKVCK